MRPIVLFAVFALVAALLHPSAAARTPASFAAIAFHNAVGSFCNHTVYSDLCVKTIVENAPTFKPLNQDTVLAILMSAVDSKAHEAKAFLLGLTKQHTLNSQTRELLRECVETYSNAIGNLADARRAIQARDTGARDALINSMIPNFESCDDGFTEFYLKSPMTAWTNVLKNMVDNCLAIVRMHSPYGPGFHLN
ncbi:hypothetical protein KSP39_PZI018049 [Platanthera zijinensis]|uniref:Pectinesterase inhibitor domain-containing protein n=1 Tax=Platanthera zijinensis TaxID=2320716 RepID=A0AAP0FYK5_9ASPA